MKKIVFCFALSLIVGLTSNQTALAGCAATGFVSTDGSTIMYGSMNNRYNGSIYSYIYANGYANGSVAFAGVNDAGTASFYCYIPTTSPLYAAAVDIKNNLKNGSFINVTKPGTSSQCSNVYLMSSSCWMQ